MTTNNSSGLVHIDRRTTMKWFMGAMAMGQLAACGDQAKGVTWQEMAVIQAKGVGTDIDFNNTAVPWPLTMTPAELVAVNALVDLILPGEGDVPFPSKVGVPVSTPWNFVSGSPTRMPPSSRNSRIVRSCGPLRFLTTERACRTVPSASK